MITTVPCTQHLPWAYSSGHRIVLLDPSARRATRGPRRTRSLPVPPTILAASILEVRLPLLSALLSFGAKGVFRMCSRLSSADRSYGNSPNTCILEATEQSTAWKDRHHRL